MDSLKEGLTPSASLYRWDAITPEPLNPKLTRQFVHGEQSMLARLVLAKGCLVPRHSHPNEQISYILSGCLRFTLGDDPEPVVVRAGEVLVIPGNLPHAAEALEDTVDLDVFAPPRQDWITRDDSYLR